MAQGGDDGTRRGRPPGSGETTNIAGDYVGGDKIGRDKAGGDIVHGDQVKTVTQSGVSGEEVAGLFAALQAQLDAAEPEARERALDKAEALRQEIDKGETADDGTLAGLIQDIVDEVPAAAKAIAALFVPAPVANIAGAITNHVLSRLRR